MRLTASIAEYIEPLRPTLLRRAWVGLKNLRVLHVRIAVWILTRAMTRDKDFRHSWYCNVRVPAYDAMRNNGMAHKLALHYSRAVGTKLMRHLFNQDCEE